MNNDIVQKVMEITAEEAGVKVEELTLETSFAEIGVDSLDFLAILAEVREKVGPVADAFITRIETIGDLAAAVGVQIETV